MPASTRATRTRAVFIAALADTAYTLLVGQAIFWLYWTLFRDVSFLSLGRQPCAYLVFSTLVALTVAPWFTTFARGALFKEMVRGDSLLAYHDDARTYWAAAKEHSVLMSREATIANRSQRNIRNVEFIRHSQRDCNISSSGAAQPESCGARGLCLPIRLASLVKLKAALAVATSPLERWKRGVVRISKSLHCLGHHTVHKVFDGRRSQILGATVRGFVELEACERAKEMVKVAALLAARAMHLEWLVAAWFACQPHDVFTGR